MQQFIGLVIAFVLLPVMIKLYPKVFKGKKASLGPILFVTGLIMAFIGGLPIGTMVSSFTKIFTTFSTLQTLIVVVEIGVLGSILKHYGILERIVRALEQLVPSKKALVMTLPAIMGMLPVPGGAFLSAPFVDSIGTDLQMKSDVKAAVNLYFRHFAMFILPYNTTMLAIASTLPQVNVYENGNWVQTREIMDTEIWVNYWNFYAEAGRTYTIRLNNSFYPVDQSGDLGLIKTPDPESVQFNTFFSGMYYDPEGENYSKYVSV